MTTALVPVRQALPSAERVESTVPPRWAGCPFLDRVDTLEAIERLAHLALVDGHTGIFLVLEQVVIALRGARGVDLHTELNLFLEREGLLL